MTELSNSIRRLHDEGFSYSKIKEELGCSKGTIAYHLGAGQKEKTLVRQRDRRNLLRKFIQEYKQNNLCTDCKEDYPYWMMEFDHLRNKSFNISEYGKHVTMKVLLEEVDKCELVCANCHKNRTHQRLLSSNGGTINLYEFYKEG